MTLDDIGWGCMSLDIFREVHFAFELKCPSKFWDVHQGKSFLPCMCPCGEVLESRKKKMDLLVPKIGSSVID